MLLRVDAIELCLNRQVHAARPISRSSKLQCLQLVHIILSDHAVADSHNQRDSILRGIVGDKLHLSMATLKALRGHAYSPTCLHEEYPRTRDLNARRSDIVADESHVV